MTTEPDPLDVAFMSNPHNWRENYGTLDTYDLYLCAALQREGYIPVNLPPMVDRVQMADVGRRPDGTIVWAVLFGAN